MWNSLVTKGLNRRLDATRYALVLVGFHLFRRDQMDLTSFVLFL